MSDTPPTPDTFEDAVKRLNVAAANLVAAYRRAWIEVGRTLAKKAP